MRGEGNVLLAEMIEKWGSERRPSSAKALLGHFTAIRMAIPQGRQRCLGSCTKIKQDGTPGSPCYEVKEDEG